ncbi:unnamed protein product [Gemmataceae bacterium]|nr:unnamed protein product [Gemmataceae bacterium]VTT99908.1 unnamed protein product [Gemmataceae bacterium]
MTAKPSTVKGIVRGGVVVFDVPTQLPEGTEVEVTAVPLPFTPEEQAEFEAWERLSDEAWEQIDWGDQEEPNAAG